jgi:mannitol-1-phosphate/altronate dehydrogenase
VDTLKSLLNTERVYFAVPDVIASNTASHENLMYDALAIHTEDGTLSIDDRADRIAGDILYISIDELINKDWQSKLFLHNTPHCIAAYLGAMNGLEYIHEVMEHPQLRNVVAGAIREMLAALKTQNMIDHSFLDWYVAKELQRFADNLLCDPIERVAREPYRKLQLDDRLIGALALCGKANVGFDNVLIGIACASIYAYNKENSVFSTLGTSEKDKIVSVFQKIDLKKSPACELILPRLDFILEIKLPQVLVKSGDMTSENSKEHVHEN